MDKECEKLVLLEMIPQEQPSLQLLEDPNIKELWLEWTKKIALSVMKHKLKEVFLLLNIQLNMVSLLHGMTWKKSGIIASTMN